MKLPEEDLDFQIARLEMKPGDILVARAGRPLAAEAAVRLKAYLERGLPDTRVLYDVELSVLGRAELKKLVGAVK